MARPKGSPKYGGRQQGSKNRTTIEMRDLLQEIMSNQLDSVKDALDEIRKEDPARYIDALSKLVGYVLPKKADITSDGKGITINWNESRDYEPDENSDIS